MTSTRQIDTFKTIIKHENLSFYSNSKMVTINNLAKIRGGGGGGGGEYYAEKNHLKSQAILAVPITKHVQ